jgi:hypothetical protein
LNHHHQKRTIEYKSHIKPLDEALAHITGRAVEEVVAAGKINFIRNTVTYEKWVVNLGPDEALHSEYTGELVAIHKLNGKNKSRKIPKIDGLQGKRIAPCFWAEQMYVLRLFSHPYYSTYIYPYPHHL